MTADHIRKILKDVVDPEIPVLTIEDLGILRDVRISGSQVTVSITPTYNGCPAMDMISVHIKSVLQDVGITDVEVKLVLHPAWTTDWITEVGRQKLWDYGIVPPQQGAGELTLGKLSNPEIPCPRCHSTDTKMVSRFGSTACKSLYQCNHCLEPFDYFKCH
ncbi:MAG: 1,2-phenylacetyl-CoA epoxidase subunit PaaD [Saprospiraceae bacterium]